MKKYFFSVMFFLSIVYLHHVHASNDVENTHLLQLHEFHDPAIDSCHEDKFYLNPAHIHLSEKGLFLQSATLGMIPLSHLFQDETGIYVMRKLHVWACTNCFKTYENRPLKCDICGNTAFRFISLLPP